MNLYGKSPGHLLNIQWEFNACQLMVNASIFDYSNPLHHLWLPVAT